MRRIWQIAAWMMFLVPALAHAENFIIGRITDGGCSVNDDGSFTESGWSYRAKDEAGESDENGVSGCVLSLMTGDVSRNVPRPRIVVNDQEIKLVEFGKATKLRDGKAVRQFRSRDGALKLRLEYWLKHDSCADPESEGKCCGQEYEGKLSISRPGLVKVLHVYQWHGM